MTRTIWEIVIVFILTLLNGFFSMSEIALISVRKTRIASLVGQGNKRAKIVQELHKNPESLFATVQVGISIITILTSAFAGSRLAGDLAAAISKTNIGFVAEHAYVISFIIVVAIVSYMSLVIGELVPKSLGLRYAETFSLLAAYPIWWLSKISYGAIKLLSFSSNLLLKPFRDSTSFTESRLSEEEIRILIAEGRKAGTIEVQEHKIIENVFEFSDMTVGKIMVPRTQITSLDIVGSPKQIIAEATASGYSRVPIYKDSINNIVGILYTKKLLGNVQWQKANNVDLMKLLVPPYFVPNSMKISLVLQKLQKKKVHMALVTNEHGEIEGLVTLEDVLEEIVGDITDETDEAIKNITHIQDGTYHVIGEVSIVDFNKFFKSELPENQDFSTVSGFILDKLRRFPKEGDTVIHADIEFIVKDITLRTVKTVAVKKKL